MASSEIREDIVQLTVAALDAAPDAALMRELEGIVDGGGSLLDAAEALASGERWEALYPSSQTPAEFSDAWLETLLPGVGAELLAFGRGIVVPHIEAGNGPAGLVLAAQDFLSAPGVPADFAAFASGFLERSEDAMAELVESETAEDLVQLTVAAYGAAPGAALMAELEATAAGGLSAAAGALVENERWEALYPSTQTPAEFSDAWLAVLLPGVGADLLAVGRAVVVPHIEGGGALAELVLLAQGFLSAPVAPAGFGDFAETFLNRSEVAAEHSVVRMLDGTAAELSDVLASVTGDDATAQAAIDALDDSMPGGQMPGDQMPGDQMPGGGSGGGGSSGGGSGGGGSGGGGSGGGGSGGGGSSGGGSGGGGSGGGGSSGGGSGGGQTPATPSSRDATDDQGRIVLTEFDDDKDGTYERAEAYTWDAAGSAKIRTDFYGDWVDGGSAADQQADKAVHIMQDYDGDGGDDDSKTETFDDAGRAVRVEFDYDSDENVDRIEEYAFDAEGALTAVKHDDDADGVWDRGNRHTKDGEGRVTLTEFDVDGDGTYTRAEAYTWNAAGTAKIRTDFHDDWDDSKGAEGRQAARAAHFLQDYDRDGADDDSKMETFDDAGRPVRVEFDYDSDEDVDRIEEYAFGADPADERWLTLSEDFDGDGTADVTTAVTYRDASDALATREKTYDDGSGPGAADDGTADRITLETFDSGGVLVNTKHDNDADGTWDITGEPKSRDTKDNQGRVVLTEFDDGGDGTWERAEAYVYGVGASKVRTDFYDAWNEDKGTVDQLADRSAYFLQNYDGDSTANDSKTVSFDSARRTTRIEYDHDTDNTIDRIEEYTFSSEPTDERWLSFSEDADGDGNADRKTTVTYIGATTTLVTQRIDHDDGTGTGVADDGDVDRSVHKVFTPEGRLAAIKHDDDGDGSWDRGHRNARDAAGRITLTEFDDDGDGTYSRAEAYAWDAAGTAKIRTDFHDGWNDGESVADQQADRALHVLQDYDGDGSADDSKTETLDAAGRGVRVAFDYDSDQDPDRIEEYVFGADPADERWLSFTEDFDGDGKADLKTDVTHHGTTDKIATRERAYDDGSGGGTADDGAVDKRVHETLDTEGNLAAIKHDDDGDGSWDRGRRHTRDGQDRITLTEFDDDGDGTHTRAEAYTRSGEDTVRTDFYGAWDDGKDAADQQADKAVHVMEDYDGDGDADDGKTETFDSAGRAVRIEFDYDSDQDIDRIEEYVFGADPADKRWLSFSEDADGDGNFDLKTTVERQGASDVLATRRIEYDDGMGSGAAADDGKVDRIKLETFDGAGKAVTIKFDNNADGVWDVVREPKSRDATDDQGRIVLTEFDDGDGTFERAEAYTWNAAGSAKVRTDFYDSWDDSHGTDDLATLHIDRTAHYMQDYDDDGTADDDSKETAFDSEGRTVRVAFDYDSDGSVDRIERYTYEGADTRWKTYWENDDATADDVFEYKLVATREGGGRITKLDASGSTVGVTLDDVLDGNTGVLTVIATDFDDSIGNEKVEGGTSGAGTFGNPGQTFNLGDGMDEFKINHLSAIDSSGSSSSAAKLTVNGDDGDDTFRANIDIFGVVTVNGGRDDDTFELNDYRFRTTYSTEEGHLVLYDGGEGDDSLILRGDLDGIVDLRTRVRISNVENIHLDFVDPDENGNVKAFFFVGDGFNDAVKVTSASAASLAPDDFDIRFSVERGVVDATVDVSKIDVSGIPAAARPSIDVEGGVGDDVLIGGPGPNVFRPASGRRHGGGDDTIRGFEAGVDTVLLDSTLVRDNSARVTTVGNDTVITYDLQGFVGGVFQSIEHKVTVEGVAAGVRVRSELSGDRIGNIAYSGPALMDGRAAGVVRDPVSGKAVSAGFDEDGDGTVERAENYIRDAQGHVSRRVIAFDDGAEDGTIDRRREETYERGVLTRVRHDLDADRTWDYVDTYSYERWDPRPRWITRDGDGRSTAYSLHQYHGGDGADDRVGGYSIVPDHLEDRRYETHWILAGPGDDIIRGGTFSAGEEWFIVDAGDGEDTILEFSTTQFDRIWIREEGVAFSDLAFRDERRDVHYDKDGHLPGDGTADDTVGGAVISWGGEDRLWLPSRSAADLRNNPGLFFFGEDHALVPDAVGLLLVRDGSGRTSEARYFEGWSEIVGLEGLDPDRVQKYAYEGTDTEWTTSSINANPFDDGVFETRVAVERYGNGAPRARVFEFDDGSKAGGAANDGVIDRKRRDEFDRDGRIVEIRHDIDNDGTWDHIDAISYDAGDGLLPRARSVTRVSDANDDGSPDDTADAVRLVFGTDGNDRGHAKIRGSDGDDWFIPGPGDDIVDIGRLSADDKDVFILEYGDGMDLLGLHAQNRKDVTDTIWLREPDFDTAAGTVGAWFEADPNEMNDYPELQLPVEAFGVGVNVAAWYYSDALDRFMIYKAESDDNTNFLVPRIAAPAALPHDPDSFIYGSRNAAWTLDDAGRVTEIRFFDAWDGLGDPSLSRPAPDRTHRYAYEGDDADWTTFSRNGNALADDVFEYSVAVERGAGGLITKETISFDDGRGEGVNGQTADDGAVDRTQQNLFDASNPVPRLNSSKYDHNNDGTWDVADVYTYTGQSATPDRVERTVGSATVVQQQFHGGTDGDDKVTGTSGADRIDAGPGDDELSPDGGADLLVFRYGDGTDIVRGFEERSDTIWIREDGFDPAQVEATLVELDADGDPNHPYIPESLHPTGGGTTKVAVLTYGGGEDDRIIIVGGTSDTATYRGHFAANDGDIPDFGG